MPAPDPVDLTAQLIRCRSVTPADDGALEVVSDMLSAAGFRVTRIDRNGIGNIHARYGRVGPVLGFNGHTDVVPTGDGWSHDPFGAEIAEGRIWGRGAADMKSGVAAWISAAIGFVDSTPDFDGSLAILITGDEEGEALDGTTAILDWMAAEGETLDACVVGEPTCPQRLGDMVKIGRRGSLTAHLTAKGIQGHAAYPHRACNPLPPLVALLDRLARWELDTGTDHFDPSTLALTTVDVGNPATNVIPAEARATLNIRFNDRHSGASLVAELESMCRAASVEGVEITMTTKISGESFITQPGEFVAGVVAAIRHETGIEPELSTSGGTSDARFIQRICPVVEFGLVGQTMHKSDENVPIADIAALASVYRRVIDGYFGKASHG